MVSFGVLGLWQLNVARDKGQAEQVRAAPTRAVTDLEEVAAADPMEAPVRVATLPRERQRALWNLLVSLRAAPGSTQQNEFKQALATAKAVFAVDAATRRRLAGVVELARRS